MEKIKKALEQAREKRDLNQGSYGVSVNNSRLKNDLSLKKDESVNQALIQFESQNDVLEKNRIINSSSKNEIAQPYKVLRTRLTQIMRENDWSSVAVVSPSQDDGKTTVGINLAISIAHGHQRAVLLDLDLMSPSIHSRFNYNPELSLNDYFESDADINEILVCPGIDGLALAPTAKPISRSSDYLASEKGARLIRSIKHSNPESMIIVDIPPLLCSDDAIAFFPNIDCVVFVVREGKTTKEDVQRSMELLAEQNIAGVILNDSVEPAAYGYYGSDQ